MKKDDPLSNGGSLLLVLGAMAFFPPLFDYEFVITSWLGGMQQPVGLSSMLVGGALFGVGKLREFRNSSPVVSPTDLDAVTPPAVAGPDATMPPGVQATATAETDVQPGDRQPA